MLRAVFDAGEAIVVRVRHELEPHQRRLLAALGAGYIVDEAAPPCERSCGREECQVSARQTERVSGMPLSMATLGRVEQFPFEPNWIDYRHSLVVVDKRRDAGEEPETCEECGCETDITPAPHSPKCPTVGFNVPPKGRRTRSEREPQAEDAAGGQAPALERTASPPAVSAGNAASRSENEQGRRRAWDKTDVIAAIQRWAQEYGQPPTSTEWARRVEGYPNPTTTTVAARFGSWANAIEEAGYPRPTHGGIRLKPAVAPEKRVRVHGTGLTYRTAEEAYVAADEIEADGERVADQARFDGNEAKAEQAIDQSRELADKIRFAASAFEERTGTSGSATSSEVEKPEEPSVQLLVSPDEMTGFQRGLARALIAGMRAAADALEQELA